MQWPDSQACYTPQWSIHKSAPYSVRYMHPCGPFVIALKAALPPFDRRVRGTLMPRSAHTAQKPEQVSPPVLTGRVPIERGAADNPDIAIPDRSGGVALIGFKNRNPSNVMPKGFKPNPQLCVQLGRIRRNAGVVFASQ